MEGNETLSDSGAGRPEIPVIARHLKATVIDGGYCVGCGACASVVGSPIVMEFGEDGFYHPTIDASAESQVEGFDVGKVCPFYDHGENEDSIADKLYPETRVDPLVGRYLETYAGHVVENGYRSAGSSGGMTTWLLGQLLASGEIDGVIHVSPGTSRLFEYGASYSEEQLKAGSKSRYYPIEISEVVELLRRRPGNYAFVGIPCFVKAVRLLAKADPIVHRSIRYCVAIFCGHLKSSAFAEYLSWQMGIEPDDLVDFDFRLKDPSRPASRYSVRAVGESRSGEVLREEPVHNLKGTNWGLGFFKPLACDFCDDITGETADVTFGDAWLPEYQQDPAGTNIVVVRNSRIADLLREGRQSGALAFDVVSVERVVASQAGNFRHRRDGLSYRLWKKDQASEWRPTKRVGAKRSHLDRNRRKIYDLRMQLSERSTTAFQSAKASRSLTAFEIELEPLALRYQALYRPWWKRLAKGVLGRLGLTGNG